MASIIINAKGQNVIDIDEIIFTSKRKIDWNSVEKYLKKYIGNKYKNDETDELIYIGNDFPDEYANSNYSAKIHGTIGKAKANASQVIPELIRIATNFKFKENKKERHYKKAKNGWYRCTVRFNLPKCNEKGRAVGKNSFHGRMIIRFAADGKKYLYDIIDIKKET